MISTRTHAVMDYLLPLGIAALAASGKFRPPLQRLMTVGPVYHLSYTVLTRHEGGLVPIIPMRKHLALDALGALAFLGAGTLLRRQPGAHRWLVAGIGAAELATIALSRTGSALN
jgi:hypothetical protein